MTLTCKSPSPPPCRTPDSYWAGAQIIEEEEFDEEKDEVARLRPVQAKRATTTLLLLLLLLLKVKAL